MHPAKAREESVLELAAEMHAIIGGICILKVSPRCTRDHSFCK
jgi:hypothetical protein